MFVYRLTVLISEVDFAGPLQLYQIQTTMVPTLYGDRFDVATCDTLNQLSGVGRGRGGWSAPGFKI